MQAAIVSDTQGFINPRSVRVAKTYLVALQATYHRSSKVVSL
jgi:hypothetical protein